MQQPNSSSDHSYFSFGFADVSAAAAFDALSDDAKRIVCAHATELHSAEDLRRMIERCQ